MGRSSKVVEPRCRKVAFGPAMPAWGSWQWVGSDVLTELGAHWDTASFVAEPAADADVVVIVKHVPPGEVLEAMSRRAAVIGCPVDYYDSAAAIDADGPTLRRCSRSVVHCERLRRYFEP